jgi:hypothetical protein
MGIMMPTRDQLIKTYKSICNAAVANGTAKPLQHAPRNHEKYPHYPITPKGLCGSRQEVYVIKGRLMVESTPVVPHAKSSWMDCGPAPMF